MIWKCTDSSFGSLSPAFAATKAEKAFGFRVNRVYLTQAGARKKTFHPPTRFLFHGRKW